jgi:hypothetical protein
MFSLILLSFYSAECCTPEMRHHARGDARAARWRHAITLRSYGFHAIIAAVFVATTPTLFIYAFPFFMPLMLPRAQTRVKRAITAER